MTANNPHGLDISKKIEDVLKTIPDTLLPLSEHETRIIELYVQKIILRSPFYWRIEKNLSMPLLRGGFIVWQIHQLAALGNNYVKGFEIKDLSIYGDVDLKGIKLEFPLKMLNCVIEGNIHLQGAQLTLLELSGSKVKDVMADFIEVKQGIFLNKGFHSKGIVRITGGSLLGDLDCRYGRFENLDGSPLDLETFTTKGNVLLSEEFYSTGVLNLKSATIGENLDCRGGTFIASKKKNIAINCDHVQILGDALLCDGVKVTGAIMLRGSRIGGRLICDGGTFRNPGDDVIVGTGMVISTSISLSKGFNSEGVVNFYGAIIGSDFNCDGGSFSSTVGNVINLDLAEIQGCIYMRGEFLCVGKIGLSGAKVKGNLDMSGARLENNNGETIIADEITVNGSVLLKQLFSNGPVRFYGANIIGDFVCIQSLLMGRDVCFVGTRMMVGGNFIWSDLIDAPSGHMNLINAKINNLLDDEKSWPVYGKLLIDGLQYQSFAYDKLANSDARLRWLRLQDHGYEGVQPYEQLAAVFEKMGLPDDARNVRIAKQTVIQKRLKGITLLWSRILGATLDFGYRPQKVFRFIIAIILIGWLVFDVAYQRGAITQSSGNVVLATNNGNLILPYPIFNSLLYSIDVFLPIVDLHQESFWLPSVNTTDGSIYLVYLILHILLGWFFTTLGVASVTGLIKSDN